MSKEIGRNMIRAVCYLGVSYICYDVIWSIANERKVRELRALEEYSLYIRQANRLQIESILSEEQKKLIHASDKHEGMKMLQRIQTQHLLDEQVKFQIESKKNLKEELVKKASLEEIEKLEKEIQQLNDFYTKIQPSHKYSDFHNVGPSKKDD